jgi:hypothetical protein
MYSAICLVVNDFGAPLNPIVVGQEMLSGSAEDEYGL